MKFISLAVNENPTYLFYVPLTCWTWNQFGWWPIVFFAGNPNTALVKFVGAKTNLYEAPIVKDVNGFKTATIAQVSRLHAASLFHNDESYLIMGDVDMIALSDYWAGYSDKPIAYGRNLSDEHYPICYVSALVSQWKEIMKTDSNDYNYFIQRDLEEFRNTKNLWTLDQSILTKRLAEYGINRISHLDRPIDKRTNYPIGRVDRSNWRLDHDVLIDAHLPHDILTNEQSFKKVLELLHLNWPSEDWTWWITYYKEFKKLMNG